MNFIFRNEIELKKKFEKIRKKIRIIEFIL